MAKKKLTMKQEGFVQKSIKTLNPTEAVRQVYNLGSKGGELTENTARAIASENLTKPAIVLRFQELLNTIDDKEILDKFQEILRDDDKRSSLSAGIELLKLKDRYPKEGNKFISLFTKIEELEDKAG